MFEFALSINHMPAKAALLYVSYSQDMNGVVANVRVTNVCSRHPLLVHTKFHNTNAECPAICLQSWLGFLPMNIVMTGVSS